MLRPDVSWYRSRGWTTIRVRPCSKIPAEGPKWQRAPATEAEVFAPEDNVGVHLGPASGGMVDVDLDCPEAIALAPAFLPPTATFGRPSKPNSHYIYLCKGIDVAHNVHARPDRNRLNAKGEPTARHVEFRARRGYQTVFPDSIHESGEPIRWTLPTPEIATPSPEEIQRAFGRLAAATLLACVWPDLPGQHHDLVFAFAGALWHERWSEEDAVSLIQPALEHVHERDIAARLDDVRSQWRAPDDARRFGWPELQRILIGPRDVSELQKAVALATPEHRPSIARGVVERTGYELNDTGNAQRLIDSYGKNWRYAENIGWYKWDGRRWLAQTDGPWVEQIFLAQEIVKQGREIGGKEGTRLETFGLASGNAGKIQSAITVASHHPGVRVQHDDLDQNPWLLNVSNGTIDLRTGELLEHDPAHMITKIAAVEYDPHARADRFWRFLFECMGGNEQLVYYLLRFLGYALTGDVSEHVLGIWHGPKGRNGKSTLLNLAQSIMGDYAVTVEHDLLLVDKYGSKHPTGLMDLRGARLAMASEIPTSAAWNESLVKRLTGGDMINARRMREDPIRFRPTHKLVMATNPLPQVRDNGRAFWSRVQLVPWYQSFEGHEDRLLPEELERERSGILNFLLWGCAAWLHGGRQLAPPITMTAAVDRYHESQDTIGEFLTECTSPDRDAIVGRTELYETFRRWASAMGYFVISSGALYRKLEEHGHVQGKINGRRCFRGFRIRPSGV